jgi:TfoX/Sxy family transcriptional regulator of competence genes
MFGGLSFMVGGQMCCGVLKDDLVLRLGHEGVDEALAQAHVRPFDFTGRPSTGMVYVAPQGLVSDEALGVWVRRAINYTLAHPRTEKRATRLRSRG